jgi:hypothetical protein
MAVAAAIRRALPGSAGLAAILLLAACASGDGAGTIGSRLFDSQARQAAGGPEVDPSYFAAVRQCPEVEIRTGTESMVLYDRGDETPDNVRWQASIRETARECRQSAGMLTIKVGVAGRVAAGPKGREGQVNVPLRIALTVNDEQVAFSRLYDVPVVLSPPTIAGDFAHVEETISVPVPAEGQRLRLYVGFDPQRGRR